MQKIKDILEEMKYTSFCWHTQPRTFDEALKEVSKRINDITKDESYNDESTVRYTTYPEWTKGEDGVEYAKHVARALVTARPFAIRGEYPALGIDDVKTIKDNIKELQKLVDLKNKLIDAVLKEESEQRKAVKELTKGVL